MNEDDTFKILKRVPHSELGPLIAKEWVANWNVTPANIEERNKKMTKLFEKYGWTEEEYFRYLRDQNSKMKLFSTQDDHQS